MEHFKDGSVKILVATDVASRGIHVEDISHVINYDIPQDPENYVHRIGRTARAGKTGRAITLACETYVFHLEPLEELLGFKIPVQWPADDWLVADQAGPVHSQRSREGRRPSDRRSPREGRSGRPERKGRPARPLPEQKAQPETEAPDMKAPLNEAPVKEREAPERGRDKSKRRESPPASRRDAPIQRGPGYFPGSFFGFTAPGKAGSDAEVETETAVDDEFPAVETEALTAAAEPVPPAEAGTDTGEGTPKPDKRRKRRPRRRRKRPASEDKASQETSAAPPVEAPEGGEPLGA
jgi:ATP-dependent RNA helicase RhlB